MVAVQEAEAEEAVAMGDNRDQNLAVEELFETETTETARPHVTQIAPDPDLDTEGHQGVEAEVTDPEVTMEVEKGKGIIVAKVIV